MSDAAGAEQRSIPQQPIIEPEDLQGAYANFCRVASTPEELVLDFGLNPQPFAGSAAPVKVSQRLVLNYYTAKRMLMAIGRALEMHERTFGPIEIDINKRAAEKRST